MKVVPDYPKTCPKTLAFRRSLVVSLMSSVLMAVALLPAATVDAADLPTVAIVATGGTIAMKLDPQTNAPVPALSGEDLIAAVPKLKELANVRVVEFSNVPSQGRRMKWAGEI
jgi:L-asparaginase